MNEFIEYLKRIGDENAAKIIGVTPRAVAAWRRSERAPRPGMARKIARLTGVPLHAIRPDVWDPPNGPY